MSVLAHEGQSLHSMSDGLFHAITGIDHLLSIIVAGVLAAVAVAVIRLSARSKP